MDTPPPDPFSEPPKNIREYFAQDVARAMEAKHQQQPAFIPAVNAEGCIAHLYGGALDGAQIVILPGSEFITLENGTVAYRFCPILTVKRGKETWIPIHLPNIKL
jgi:hypothetical protein